MHSYRIRLALAATLALALVTPACDGGNEEGGSDDLTFAGFALTADDEADDGFDEEADTTAFLDELGDAYDDAAAPTDDEMDTEPLPIEDGEDDDALVVRRTLLFVWGQPVLNPDAADPVVWDGAISTDTGFLKPLRKVRFEGQDTLHPDNDPRAVTFTTTTRPHHDGVIVRLIVPKDKIEGGTLTFATDNFVRTAKLSEVLDGFHEVAKADDAGNIVRVDTLPKHICDHGFMAAKWKRLGKRGGIFGGKWINADGTANGYWMGLWGTVDGKRRMKGIYLDNDKNFGGTIKGAYKPFPQASGLDGGVFLAKWRSKDGEVGGVLRGTYTSGDEPGQGTAHGRWLKKCADGPNTCGGAIEAPAEPVCSCSADADGSAYSPNGDEVCTCQLADVTTCVEDDATTE